MGIYADNDKYNGQKSKLDLVNRQDVIDALGEEPLIWHGGDDEIAERNQWLRDKAAIESLPSAGPKTGKWIKIPEFCGDDVSGFIDNHFSCSECKKEAEINLWGFYILSDFCPNCGADMRGNKYDKR